MGYYNEYLYEDAITWTTDGANAGTVHFRDGKFYCTNVCGVLLNEDGNANRCVAEILGSVSKKYVSYVGNPKLMNNVMSEIRIHIPSLLEQKKIDGFIASLDHRIAKQRELIEHLKKYKRGVIERMITELTMTCDLRKISSFAKCIAGATPDTKNHEYWDNGTIPWLSSGEVNKKRITSTDKFITPLGYQKTSTKMLPIKTVIVALAGQGKTRGTVAITEKEVCTNQSLAGIITDNTVDSEYLFYYLETQYDNLRILSSGDGTRGGLNLQLINDYLVPTPSLDKQKFIAAFGTLIDKNISGNENLLNQLQLLRSAMLQQLFV